MSLRWLNNESNFSRSNDQLKWKFFFLYFKGGASSIEGTYNEVFFLLNWVRETNKSSIVERERQIHYNTNKQRESETDSLQDRQTEKNRIKRLIDRLQDRQTEKNEQRYRQIDCKTDKQRERYKETDILTDRKSKREK